MITARNNKLGFNRRILSGFWFSAMSEALWGELSSSGSPTGPRPVSKIIQVYSGKSVNVLSDLRWFSSEQHPPRWRELLVFAQPRGTSRKPVHQFSTCIAVTILNFIFTRRVKYQIFKDSNDRPAFAAFQQRPAHLVWFLGLVFDHPITGDLLAVSLNPHP